MPIKETCHTRVTESRALFLQSGRPAPYRITGPHPAHDPAILALTTTVGQRISKGDGTYCERYELFSRMQDLRKLKPPLLRTNAEFAPQADRTVDKNQPSIDVD
jgi:hypothetical protein